MVMDKYSIKGSIIVVNYNGLDHLDGCFSSIMQIDYPKELLEYILVDNGSTDGSVKYMESNFPEVRIIRLDRNYGFAKANNEAAKIAQGEILALLNNDIKVHPSWLKKLIDKFVESSGDLACVSSKILNGDGNKVDFIGGGFTPFGISFQVDFGKPLKEIDDEKEDKEKELLFACGGAMAVRKDIYLECGGFDEEYFAYLEDVDLGWRLRIMGYRILYVPEAIAFHKHGGTRKKIPSHQLAFMLERNRILTIIKNTEDAYLPYFLSTVYMFNINRTFLSSMSNIEEFVFCPLSRREQGSREKEVEQSSRSLWKKVSLMLKKRDIGILFRWFIRKNLWLINRLTGYKFVSRETLSCSAAFNSIIPELRSLILKRKEIQAKRKISDCEIIPLFLMDQFPKQAIAKDSVFVIEKIMEFEKEIMKENRVRFPE